MTTSWVDRVVNSDSESQGKRIPIEERVCYNCGDKGHERVNCKIKELSQLYNTVGQWSGIR